CRSLLRRGGPLSADATAPGPDGARGAPRGRTGEDPWLGGGRAFRLVPPGPWRPSDAVAAALGGRGNARGGPPGVHPTSTVLAPQDAGAWVGSGATAYEPGGRPVRLTQQIIADQREAQCIRPERTEGFEVRRVQSLPSPKTGATGRFFVTPYAVARYRERLRP